jgi:hypothetical protein
MGPQLRAFSLVTLFSLVGCGIDSSGTGGHAGGGEADAQPAADAGDGVVGMADAASSYDTVIFGDAAAAPDMFTVAPDAGVVDAVSIADGALPHDVSVLPADAAAPVDGPALPVDAAVHLDAAPPAPDVATAPDVLPADSGIPLFLDGPAADVAPDLAPDSAPDVATPPDTSADLPTTVVLFQDDFESGNLQKWSHTSGPATVDATCALSGGHGLRLPGNATTRLDFDLPAPRAHVRISARIDVTAFSPPPQLMNVVVFPILSVRGAGDLTAADAAYAFMADHHFQLHADAYHLGGGSTQIHTDALTIAPHTVELTWQGSSYAGAADGSLRLIVDGNTNPTAPDTAANEMTVLTQISRVSIGLTGSPGGTGYVCVDDIVISDEP